MCSGNKQILTQKEAASLLNWIAKKGAQHSKQQRKYWCRYCKGWHLTSQKLIEEPTEIKSQFNQHWKQFIQNENK